MKKIYIALFVISFLLIFLVLMKIGTKTEYSENELLEAGDYKFEFLHDNLSRKYLVHTPENYSKNNPAPLVIVLHGGGSNAESAIKYFELNEKSDEEGFIIIYAEGTGKQILGTTYATWNAGRCCESEAGENIDDVGYIRKVLEDVEKKFNINKNKIFAVGMSNGGMMAYRLGCEMSEVFSGIAISGGQGVFDECSPSEPVPVIHFHGAEDPCVPYSGGKCGGCFIEMLNENLGTNTTVDYWNCENVVNYLAKWSELNNCSKQTKNYYQNKNATCIKYIDCDADVVLCTINGMGHVWPGKEMYDYGACQRNYNGYLCQTYRNAIGELNSDINANEILWNFFENNS